jgi:glycosyltransferase involved in cell wall biosynthesis
MRAVLLTRRLDDKPTNGFERYAHNLYYGLRSLGADVGLINQDSPLPVRPSSSLISPPYYDIILPLLRLPRKMFRADLYHALTDSQAVLFPFLKGKKVVTIHHVDLTPPGSPSEAVFRRFYTLGTELAVRYADHFICISEQTKKELMEHYRVREEDITVVLQSISPLCRPMAKTGRAVGYFGALKKRKNVEFLIRAFAIMQERHRMPECRLIICGEGPDKDWLMSLARELGVGSLVDFKGEIPEDRITETYNSFTVFGFPSLQEGFGVPILEAQACGVPVLTLEGAMVPHEVTRHAIPCRDEADMAEKMHWLLTDDEAREKVVREGIEYASSFSGAAVSERTLRVYEKVLGE